MLVRSIAPKCDVLHLLASHAASLDLFARLTRSQLGSELVVLLLELAWALFSSDDLAQVLLQTPRFSPHESVNGGYAATAR